MKPYKSEGGLWAVEVEGDKYEWVRWGAEDAVDTFAEILDLVGKPLGAWVAASQGAGLGTNVGATIIGAFVRKIKRNKADVLKVLKRLTAGERVFCNGKAVTFDTHYQNRLAHMFKVANAGIEVQYGDFLDVVLDALGLNIAEAKASLRKSAPTTPTSNG